MRQAFGNELYDADQVLRAVAKYLGVDISKRREGELKQVFRDCHTRLEIQRPHYLWAAHTVDYEYGRYLGHGVVPTCVFSIYAEQVDQRVRHTPCTT